MAVGEQSFEGTIRGCVGKTCARGRVWYDVEFDDGDRRCVAHDVIQLASAACLPEFGALSPERGDRLVSLNELQADCKFSLSSPPTIPQVHAVSAFFRDLTGEERFTALGVYVGVRSLLSRGPIGEEEACVSGG